jgi:hypothetical protein
VGRLALTATEDQNAADAGAAAYAHAMLENAASDGFVDPATRAAEVVEGNSIDGKAATQAQVTYTTGRFDFASRRFQQNGSPTNAVRASVAAQVNTLFAGVLGQRTARVTRTALAAYGGAHALQPTLPLAIGTCYFERFRDSEECGDLPTLTQIPDGRDNSCWTSLGSSTANANRIVSLLPEVCCQGGRCGGGELADPLAVGDRVNVTNGAVDVALRVLANCVQQGLRRWTVPVVECGRCNQSLAVVGFATIDITTVRTGRSRGIDLRASCAAAPGTSGVDADANFGTVTVALVE